eukprot:100804-Rhodomonas_salina.1
MQRKRRAREGRRAARRGADREGSDGRGPAERRVESGQLRPRVHQLLARLRSFARNCLGCCGFASPQRREPRPARGRDITESRRVRGLTERGREGRGRGEREAEEEGGEGEEAREGCVAAKLGRLLLCCSRTLSPPHPSASLDGKPRQIASFSAQICRREHKNGKRGRGGERGHGHGRGKKIEGQEREGRDEEEQKEVRCE